MASPAVAPTAPIRGAVCDLLMAVMDSMSVWAGAAGDRRRGLAWRDAVTARMAALVDYRPYLDVVAVEAVRLHLPATAPEALLRTWSSMRPWPDAAALARLSVPMAFLTNCSTQLAQLAADRSGLQPIFVLSAEEVGSFKPDARAYRAACTRLGTLPEQTLFVAGSVYDAAGAAAVGLQARYVERRPGVARPATSIPTLPSLHAIVDDVGDRSAGRPRC